MELKCKLKQILDYKEGYSTKQWCYQSFLVSTHDQYPKDMAIQGWGALVQTIQNLHIGDHLNIQIDIASREYNGRWYTDVKAISIEFEPEAEPPLREQAKEQMKVESVKKESIQLGLGNELDDLPF